ncbi:hypothetical protein PGTUg99_024838 [Puccinia graminis f. sp. tritici]|uniref:Uncharacterized protein n=1 Tax=Puccinia graminis f. sp. tritici TaxID=56615 RepID=A0A5B0RSY5_PUCGR|nr:hypothetical protein PGTUg99_024838 [Puccinia graminis f. sp. tritici]
MSREADRIKKSGGFRIGTSSVEFAPSQSQSGETHVDLQSKKCSNAAAWPAMLAGCDRHSANMAQQVSKVDHFMNRKGPASTCSRKHPGWRSPQSRRRPVIELERVRNNDRQISTGL